MVRLFVALRPPPAIRAALIGLMGGIQGARWQDDDQLHITLRFIGEVDARMADDVLAALGGVHAAPFDLRIAGLGSFAKRERPHTVWAGVAPRDAIAALHRKIDHALVRIGLAGEARAFLPHITLARLPRDAGPVDGFLAVHAGLASEPFAATHLILYQSHLGSEGARYEPVARWPLGN